MNRLRTLSSALLLTLAAGCGGGPDTPPPVDPGEARRQLGDALEAWKKGESHQSLGAREPPVVFNEPLWEGGTRLVAYELGEAELQGRQARCKARLTLVSRDGKQSERSIAYIVDTNPRVVITRESLGI
jgi:hypothetical protein